MKRTAALFGLLLALLACPRPGDALGAGLRIAYGSQVLGEIDPCG